jgi:iron complex transport system substrate-binding protein
MAGGGIAIRTMLLALAALAGCAEPRPPAASVALRVVSINPCVDAVLLEVADPSQIVAVSHYSHDPRAASVPVEWARRFPATSGTAEEVVALSPDVVIAGGHVAPSTAHALRRLGIKLVQIGVPASIEESAAQVRTIAAVAGQQARGERLAARIEAAGALRSGNDEPIPALIWQGGGLVPGTRTLAGDMLARAGFRNMSADYGLDDWDILPLERLVAAPPRVLLTVGGEDARGDRRLAHPVLAPLAKHMMRADYPVRLMHCGGPTIIEAMARLRAVRARAAGA